MSNVFNINNAQNNVNLNTILTDTVRRRFYIVYALVGLLIGATQTVYWSLELGQPKWLLAAFAVYAYVGATFGFVAGNNTPKKETNPSEPDDEELPTDSVVVGNELPSTENEENVPESETEGSNEQPEG